MNPNLYPRAVDFIWKNARLLDRRIFACLFLGASPREVVDALKVYQNTDGGFGSALEPDRRCPFSQPIDVQVALEVLEMVGMLDESNVQRDIVLPACDFLASIANPNGGVPTALPTLNAYPHAPWWETPDNPPAALNPLAAIVGLLLKYGTDHPFIAPAVDYCWRAIETSETEQYHDLLPMIAFLENAPDHARASKELDRITARIQKPGLVAYDPAAQGYVKFPLDWAPTPASFCRTLFSDAVIRADLQRLAARQQADGGWTISWQALSPAVEAEWRGWATVMALRTLKEFGEI
jgi:hypothetical protein